MTKMKRRWGWVVMAEAVLAAVVMILLAYSPVSASTTRRHGHRHPVPVQADQPAPPTASAGSGAMPGMPPPPGTGGSSTSPPAQQPGMGLTYDPAKVPAGTPGDPRVRLNPTTEMPVPAGDGVGAFRTVCLPARWLPDDPIVAPGQPGASHLHLFWGNAGVDANSTAQSIATTGNATCRGGIINRTGYWAPALINTATGAVLAPTTINVYYKTGYLGVRPADVRAMPQGLRMVAGNSKATGPQSSFADWGCGTVFLQVPAIPTASQCSSGQIIMDITFPQCWNGRDLDSADHKSHLTYATAGKGCPAGWTPLPEISFHVAYTVPTSSLGSLRLSSDMYSGPGGYSIHGDWWGGWDPKIEDTWVRDCLQAAMDCHSDLVGRSGQTMAGADLDQWK